MDKHGYEFNVILLAIVGSISLILLGFWVADAGERIDSNIPKEVCKRSVQAHAALNVKGMSFGSDEFKCPTQEVVIPKRADDEKANEMISHAMFNCWDQFHRGTLTLFGKDGIYCAICHKVTFEDTSGQLEGLAEFQRTETVPSGGEKYFEFFSPTEHGETDWLIDQMKPGSLSAVDSAAYPKDQDYVTMFVYARGTRQLEELGKVLEGMKSNRATPFFIAGGVIAVATTGAALATGGIVGTILMGIGGTASTITVKGGTAIALTEYLTKHSGPDHAAFIAFREFDADSLKDFHCEEMI